MPKPRPSLSIDTSKESESMLYKSSNEDQNQESDIQLIVKQRDTQHIPLGDQQEPLIIRWTYEEEVLAHNHLPYMLEEEEEGGSASATLPSE